MGEDIPLGILRPSQLLSDHSLELRFIVQDRLYGALEQVQALAEILDR